MTEAPPLARPLPALVVGARVRLELWRADMLDEVHALVERSRPTLSGFLPWASGATLEEEAEVQSEADRLWREGRAAQWAVIEDGGLRGMVGLHRRGGPDELEIGYWLDDAATGRGLMTESCALATDVSFEADGIDAVEIIHDRANHRSEGVPSRLGFARVGAFTAPPQASLESGVKVRWVVRRAVWRAARPVSSVLEAR